MQTFQMSAQICAAVKTLMTSITGISSNVVMKFSLVFPYDTFVEAFWANVAKYLGLPVGMGFCVDSEVLYHLETFYTNLAFKGFCTWMHAIVGFKTCLCIETVFANLTSKRSQIRICMRWFLMCLKMGTLCECLGTKTTRKWPFSSVSKMVVC